MMKKSFLKTVALLLCLGFLLAAVPSLNAVEKRAVKINFKLTLTRSVATIFPWLAAIIGSGSKTNGAALPSFGGIVKPTGDAPIGKPGSGD
jgi:hypothetical protein